MSLVIITPIYFESTFCVDGDTSALGSSRRRQKQSIGKLAVAIEARKGQLAREQYVKRHCKFSCERASDGIIAYEERAPIRESQRSYLLRDDQ